MARLKAIRLRLTQARLATIWVGLAGLTLSAPSFAQSVGEAKAPTSWTKIDGGSTAAQYRTPYGEAITTTTIGTPEEAVRAMLVVAGAKADTIDVRSEGEAARASTTTPSGRMAVAFAHRMASGRNAVVLMFFSANDEATAHAAMNEGIEMLANLSGHAAMSKPSEANITTGGKYQQKVSAKAPSGLVGLWMGIDSGHYYDPSIGGFSYQTTSDGYTVTPGGYFVDGVPTGAGFDDAGARRQINEDPDRGGTFAVTPTTIELRFASGRSESLKYTKSGNSYNIPYGAGYLNKKTIAPDGFRLNGTWHNKRLTNTTSGAIAGSTYVHFTSNGQFLYSNSVSFSSAAVSTVNRDPAAVGTYSVKNGAITLSFANGQSETMSIWWETSPTSAMWLDNEMYKPAG